MNIKEYIASGILELYVAGVLSEKEMQEVYTYSLEHQEIYDEIIKIEHTIVTLTKTASPKRTTVPEFFFRSPSIKRIVVLFPEPFGPRNP